MGVARVAWDAGPDARSASELLAGVQSSALSEAVNWLSTWRAGHPGPTRVSDLLAAAAEAGIKRAALHRARKQLRLGTTKTREGWVVG